MHHLYIVWSCFWVLYVFRESGGHVVGNCETFALVGNLTTPWGMVQVPCLKMGEADQPPPGRDPMRKSRSLSSSSPSLSSSSFRPSSPRRWELEGTLALIPPAPRSISLICSILWIYIEYYPSLYYNLYLYHRLALPQELVLWRPISVSFSLYIPVSPVLAKPTDWPGIYVLFFSFIL